MKANELIVGTEYIVNVKNNELQRYLYSNSRVQLKAKLVRKNVQVGWHIFEITTQPTGTKAYDKYRGRQVKISSNSVVRLAGPKKAVKKATKKSARARMLVADQQGQAAAIIALLEAHDVSAVSSDLGIVITGGDLKKFHQILVTTFASTLVS